MDVHSLEFSLVCSECLFNHLCKIFLANSSKKGQVWHDSVGTVGYYLADEVSVLELVIVSQSFCKDGIEYLVISHFAIFVNKSVSEDSR